MARRDEKESNRSPVQNAVVRRTRNERGAIGAFVWISAGICLMVLVLGAAVVGLLFCTSTKPAFRQDPSAAARLANEIREAKKARAAGIAHTLLVDEAEVNSAFDAQLHSSRNRRNPTSSDNGANGEQASANVRDLKVNLTADRLRVYLVLGVQGRDLTVDLEGRLRSKNGYMDFEPINGKIGALPLPQPLLAKVMQAIMDSPEYRQKLRLPPGISDLRVENSEFVVSYK